MSNIARMIFAATMVCGTSVLVAPSFAQVGSNTTPGVGSTVMHHEAKSDGTPMTGPMGPGETAVTPGQNAIYGQPSKDDCDAPGQNQRSTTSPAGCPKQKSDQADHSTH